MATLFIGVFDGAAETLIGEPVQEITITLGGASVQSAAIDGPAGRKRLVRLYADGDCFVTWGDDPTALNTGLGGRPLGADNPEVFGIVAGNLIAAIEKV